MSTDFPYKTLKEAWVDGWSARRIAKALEISEGLVLGVLRDTGVDTSSLHKRRSERGRDLRNITKWRLCIRVRREMRTERDLSKVAEKIGVPRARVVTALRYYTQKQLRGAGCPG